MTDECLSSYSCSRVPACRGPAACPHTRCSRSACWSASSSRCAVRPAPSSAGDRAEDEKKNPNGWVKAQSWRRRKGRDRAGKSLLTDGDGLFLTFSPSRTSKGTLFMPPLIHSSRVTVPLSSTSMAVIMSFSTCTTTTNTHWLHWYYCFCCCSNESFFLYIFVTEFSEIKLVRVWARSRPSPGNQQLASSGRLYDPLPDGETEAEVKPNHSGWVNTQLHKVKSSHLN